MFDLETTVITTFIMVPVRTIGRIYLYKDKRIRSARDESLEGIAMFTMLREFKRGFKKKRRTKNNL